jgi:two-component system chemotaxis response regulator CheY
MTAAESELDLSKFKVLIAEDFEFIAEILASSLREMGAEDVMTVANGKAAQEKLQLFNNMENMRSIDVVILDWLMPVIDGKTVLRWIRSHKSDAIRFMPVIVCSAYTSESLVYGSRDLGANEMIVKPVSAEAIAKRIQYVINRPRPFVKTPTFFGPDRRRQNKKFEGTDRRKLDPQHVKNTHERK